MPAGRECSLHDEPHIQMYAWASKHAAKAGLLGAKHRTHPSDTVMLLAEKKTIDRMIIDYIALCF